jgi:hypothetical protein
MGLVHDLNVVIVSVVQQLNRSAAKFRRKAIRCHWVAASLGFAGNDAVRCCRVN